MKVWSNTIRPLFIICLFVTLNCMSVHASTSAHKKHHKADAAAQVSSAAKEHHSRVAEAKERRSELAALKLAKAEASKREAKLAKLAQAKSDVKKSSRAKRIAAMRAAKLEKLAAVKAQDKSSARSKRIAALRTDRLAKIAQAKAALSHAKNAKLAAIQSREAAQRSAQMAKIAEAEAEREKHKDKMNDLSKIAASSQLPIWQGDAYAAQVPVKVVTVNLDDPRVRVSALLARNGIGTAEPFTHMIDRARPAVAVTGTFFSLDNLRPVGDIVVNGALAYFGGMGTALAITPGNRADMITVPWGHHHNWTGYNTVVSCGPRLLRDRQIVLDPRMEHFKDKHMLSPNSRIAVGITGHNQLVFCMTRQPIYLGRLAKIMKSIGCKEAMNLDAGTSTGFYCNGRMMARPGRWLTNAIVVYSDGKSGDYEHEEASALPTHRMGTVTLASYRK